MMRAFVILMLLAVGCIGVGWSMPLRPQAPMTVTEIEATACRVRADTCAQSISPARGVAGLDGTLAHCGSAKRVEGIASFAGTVAGATATVAVGSGVAVVSEAARMEWAVFRDRVAEASGLGLGCSGVSAVAVVKAETLLAGCEVVPGAVDEAGLCGPGVAIRPVATEWPGGRQALPAIRSQTLARPSAVDPLLSIVETPLWADGPVGDLGRRARAALERGDHAEFRRLSGQYWQALSAAMERRQVYEKRVREEKFRGRVTRDSGVPAEGVQMP